MARTTRTTPARNVDVDTVIVRPSGRRFGVVRNEVAAGQPREGQRPGLYLRNEVTLVDVDALEQTIAARAPVAPPPIVVDLDPGLEVDVEVGVDPADLTAGDTILTLGVACKVITTRRLGSGERPAWDILVEELATGFRRLTVRFADPGVVLLAAAGR